MRNIVIVEAVSTGYNMVEDVMRRGYRPVVLECASGSDYINEVRKNAYDKFFHTPEIIKWPGSYEEALEQVRSFDPLLVVPGSEYGVETATRLAEELGLLGNPYANVGAMTQTQMTQEALEKAGLRFIKEQVADNPEDVEYIVNTASCDGVHRLTSMFRYAKVKTEDGGNIYDYCESINRPEAGYTALMEYAYKVADAIGFRYGLISGKYMIDKKGPVLIGVNCSPMGGTISEVFLDRIFGQHESDALLDAYLEPEDFAKKAKMPYRTMKKGVIKYITIPNEIEVEDHPIWVVAKQLKSLFRADVSRSREAVIYKKTKDLETAGGCIFLLHEDESIVMADLELLRETEKKYFSMLYSEGTSRKWFMNADAPKPDYAQIIKECDCHGATLVAGDERWECDGVQTETAETLYDAHRGFDNVIIGYQEALIDRKESACLELVFKTIDLVKTGGRVIIPKTTYEYLSYKRDGAELLMRIKNLMIEMPPVGMHDYVIGTKVK